MQVQYIQTYKHFYTVLITGIFGIFLDDFLICNQFPALVLRWAIKIM